MHSSKRIFHILSSFFLTSFLNRFFPNQLKTKNCYALPSKSPFSHDATKLPSSGFFFPSQIPQSISAKSSNSYKKINDEN